MNNFEGRKYLAEGKLYENNNYKNLKGLQLEENDDELVDSYLEPIYFKDHDENPQSFDDIKDFAKGVIYDTFSFNVDEIFEDYKKGVEELEVQDWYDDEDRKLHDKIKTHKFEVKDIIQINDDEYFISHPLDLDHEFDLAAGGNVSHPSGTINYL